MADIKNTVITTFVAETKGAEAGMKTLRKEQQKNEKQAKKTGKTLKSSIGDAVGAISGGIGNMSGEFTGLIGTLQKVVGGFKTLRVAMLASPIGLIVGLLAGLFAAFTQTQKGADLLSDAIEGTSAAFEVIIGRAAKVFETLTQIGELGFSGAMKQIKEDVAGIGQELKESAEAAVVLNRRMQDQRQAARDVALFNAKSALEIEKQLFISKDQDRTADERRKALAEANRLESQAQQQQLEFQREQLAIEEQRLKDTPENLRNEEQLNKINEERIILLELERGSRARQRELLNRTFELESALSAQEKARFEERKKLREEELEGLGEIKKKEVELELGANNALEGLTLQRVDTTLSIEEEAAKQRAQIKMGLLQAEAQLENQFAIVAKAKALREIALNTAEAISEGVATAQTARPFPANLIAVISTVATVLTNIAAARSIIASISTGDFSPFARGGFLRGPSHAGGGVNINAEGGEAIINKRSMANPTLRLMASRINEAGGGVAFAQNGMLVGQSLSSSIRSLSSDFDKIIGGSRPVLVTEDLNRVENRIKTTENIATL